MRNSQNRQIKVKTAIDAVSWTIVPTCRRRCLKFWGELAYMESVKSYEPVIMACLVIYRLLGYLIVRYRRNPARLVDKSIVSLRSFISTRSNILLKTYRRVSNMLWLFCSNVIYTQTQRNSSAINNYSASKKLLLRSVAGE